MICTDTDHYVYVLSTIKKEKKPRKICHSKQQCFTGRGKDKEALDKCKIHKFT